MHTKREDRRVQRTRNMLFDALIDLMIEKGYEELTVQDIIDRANVGRSTFYSHFFDKEQLLIGNIDRLREHLIEHIGERFVSVEHSTFRFGFPTIMLQHIQSHRRLYQATVGKPSGALVLHHIRRMLADVANEEITVYLSKNNLAQIPYDVASEFVVTTFLTVVTWWMSQDIQCSVEECDRMFHRLVFSGISSL